MIRVMVVEPGQVARPVALAVAAVVAMGCVQRPAQLRPAPLGAQAVSLLGDTLWTVPMSIGEAQLRLDALTDARRRQARGRRGEAGRLLLARRTAEMGRLREAFDLYTEVLQDDPEEWRARRRRGEIYLLLRELGPARRELRQVVQATGGQPDLQEFMELPEGGFVGSGVFASAALLLGITDYLRGSYGAAGRELEAALEQAQDADELSAIALWLFFALRRGGREAEAASVVRAIRPDLPVVRRRAEHRLLLFLQGTVSLDSLRRAVANAPGSEEELLDLYGLGFVLLETGQAADAKAVFEQIRSTGNWATIPYLAAEAELARLARSGSRVERS